jgi:GYF domain 2
METLSRAEVPRSVPAISAASTHEYHRPMGAEPAAGLDNQSALAASPVTASFAPLGGELVEGNGPMATQWHCRIMGEEWGPLSTLELIAVARHGRLTRDDIVRRAGTGTWVRAELVKGLFNAPPVAETITSDRFVAAVKRPAPALRSMRKFSPMQYWLRIDKKISGPFTSSELRQLAERGALKPYHYIGKDRQHWTRAIDVKGLAFGGASADEETLSARSAVLLEKPVTTAGAGTTRGELRLARR